MKNAESVAYFILLDTFLALPYVFFFFLMIRRPPRPPLFPYTTLSRSHRAELVPRLADDVQDPAEHFFPHRHRDGRARALHRHAADEAVGRVHRDAAGGVLAEVLREIGRAHV